jgi:hypothetical protein
LTASPKEFDQVLECRVGMKANYGYSGIPARYLDTKQKGWEGCSLMIVMWFYRNYFRFHFEGVTDDHVHETLYVLCNVFHVISRKSINVKCLERLKDEIVSILCVF